MKGKISQAIGLLSSMVSCGERHSDTSDKAVEDAMHELVAMQKVVEAAKDWRVWFLVNHRNPTKSDQEDLLLYEVRTLAKHLTDNLALKDKPTGGDDED